MSNSPLPIGDPRELGFDPDRLAAIGPAMQHYVDTQKVPNLVTLLARKGQLVHFEARGVLDLEQGNPVGKDSLFRMFSNTKPIAGVATLILFERGILTPDDPVARFLPEWANLQVVNRNELTITEPAKTTSHHSPLPNEYHGSNEPNDLATHVSTAVSQRAGATWV